MRYLLIAFPLLSFVACSDAKLMTDSSNAVARAERVNEDIASPEEAGEAVEKHEGRDPAPNHGGRGAGDLIAERAELEQEPANDENVAVPQQIAGAYLIACVPSPQAASKLLCRMEDKSSHMKANYSDLVWQIRDGSGKLLAEPDVIVKKLPSSDPWQVLVEINVQAELNIGASSKDLAVSNAQAGASTFSYKPMKLFDAEDFATPPTIARWNTWQKSGQLDFSAQTMRCNSNANSIDYSGMSSQTEFKFADGAAQVRVLNVLAAEEGMQQAMWGIMSGDGGATQFYVSGGNLYARVKEERTPDTSIKGEVLIKRFDPIADQYLRMQHSRASGKIHFQHSADGLSWVELAVLPAPTWIENDATFETACGAWKPVAKASSSEIDDIRIYLP